MYAPNNLLRSVLCLALASLGGLARAGNPADARVVHPFSATETRPDSNLILGPDGAFYGTIETGGPAGGGIVYRVAPDGTSSTFFAFSASTGIDPAPDSLVVGDDGNFYGITGSGGPVSADHGTFYRLDPTGVCTVLHGFTDADGGNVPNSLLDFEGPLTLGDDGAFWGISPYSSYHNGAIFRITKAGVPSYIVQFDPTVHKNSGALEVSRMIKGPGQAFYGVLSDRVFRMPMIGAFSILHQFDNEADPDSGQPTSGIVFDKAGEILGATSTGAIYTIELVNAPYYNGMYSVVKNALPEGTCFSPLAVDAAGLIYGTIDSSDNDFVFVYYPQISKQVASPIIFLPGNPNGEYQGEPSFGFATGLDGNFYGLTNDGSAGGFGAVYSFTPFDSAPATPNLVKFGGVHGFSETDGSSGSFTFKRVGDPTLPLTVNYKISNTPNNGVYFQKIAKSITFPSGVAKVKLKIVATGANVTSQNLTITLKNNDPGYTIGNTASATVTITK